MIKAIIFDFDGTILETELPDFTSWQEAYREHNCELPLDLWLNAVGGSAADFDPYGYLEQQLGRSLDRLALRAKRRARLAALITHHNIRPGVLEVIHEAKQLGLHLGIASSSSRDWVEGYLALFDLRQHFEVIFTREDVERVKPDPALYTLAVSALGVAPAQAVAIEDSRNGMLAAKAAGLKCVVVPNEMTQQLRFPEADLQMRSLADRPLHAWLEELHAANRAAEEA
jgi:HAD superfamily hydrolase (TIGR01509 family)